MKADRAEDLPLEPLLADLGRLRETIHETLAALEARWLEDVRGVEASVESLRDPELQRGKGRDVRDLLMVLRGLDIKAAKGRRKDLKKIETTLEDLALLVKGW